MNTFYWIAKVFCQSTVTVPQFRNYNTFSVTLFLSAVRKAIWHNIKFASKNFDLYINIS